MSQDTTRKPVIRCDHVSKTCYNKEGDHLVVADLHFDVYEKFLKHDHNG